MALPDGGVMDLIEERILAMLVEIYSGRDRQSAQCEGSFHFSSTPAPGERMELAGARYTVTEAWHRPDIQFRGANFAILVTDAVEKP